MSFPICRPGTPKRVSKIAGTLGAMTATVSPSPIPVGQACRHAIGSAPGSRLNCAGPRRGSPQCGRDRPMPCV